jgi:hypothetical protein
MQIAVFQALQFRFPGGFRSSVGLPGFPLAFPVSRRVSRSSAAFPRFPRFLPPYRGRVPVHDFRFQVSPWRSSFSRGFCPALLASRYYPLALFAFQMVLFHGSGFQVSPWLLPLSRGFRFPVLCLRFPGFPVRR